MSIAISVDVHDAATRKLAELRGGLDQERVNAVIGGSARRIVQDHLRTLDKSKANKLGGKRTHYFAQAARSTNYRSDVDGVTVAISQVGIGLRYFGGEVRPVNGKYLTIPARAEAHGRRAGEFNNLEIVWGKNGPRALAERRATAIRFNKKGVSRGETRGGGIMYWLVKSVTQTPDPDVLPKSDTILFGARSALLNHVRVSARLR